MSRDPWRCRDPKINASVFQHPLTVAGNRRRLAIEGKYGSIVEAVQPRADSMCIRVHSIYSWYSNPTNDPRDSGMQRNPAASARHPHDARPSGSQPHSPTFLVPSAAVFDASSIVYLPVTMDDACSGKEMPCRNVPLCQVRRFLVAASCCSTATACQRRGLVPRLCRSRSRCWPSLDRLLRALHHAWVTRRPVVVVLAVDPARFREPMSVVEEPWRLDARFEVWLDRLHFLVWANNYDARGGKPAKWWWSHKARKIGASDITDGTVRRCPAPRRHGGVDRRWTARAVRACRTGCGGCACGVGGAGPAGARSRAGRRHVGAGSRPTGRRLPRCRSCPHCRAGRIGQDARADRAAAAPDASIAVSSARAWWP